MDMKNPLRFLFFFHSVCFFPSRSTEAFSFDTEDPPYSPLHANFYTRTTQQVSLVAALWPTTTHTHKPKSSFTREKKKERQKQRKTTICIPSSKHTVTQKLTLTLMPLKKEKMHNKQMHQFFLSGIQSKKSKDQTPHLPLSFFLYFFLLQIFLIFIINSPNSFGRVPPTLRV